MNFLRQPLNFGFIQAHADFMRFSGVIDAEHRLAARAALFAEKPRQIRRLDVLRRHAPQFAAVNAEQFLAGIRPRRSQAQNRAFQRQPDDLLGNAETEVAGALRQFFDFRRRRFHDVAGQPERRLKAFVQNVANRFGGGDARLQRRLKQAVQQAHHAGRVMEKRLELRLHALGRKFGRVAVRQHVEQRRAERVIIGGGDRLPAKLLERNVAERADDRCSGQDGCADAILHRAEIHEIHVIDRRKHADIRGNDDVFRVYVAVNHRRAERVQKDENVHQIEENL